MTTSYVSATEYYGGRGRSEEFPGIKETTGETDRPGDTAKPVTSSDTHTSTQLTGHTTATPAHMPNSTRGALFQGVKAALGSKFDKPLLHMVKASIFNTRLHLRIRCRRIAHTQTDWGLQSPSCLTGFLRRLHTYLQLNS